MFRLGALVSVLLFCVPGCGDSTAPPRGGVSAAESLDLYIEAGQQRDVDSLLAQVHPEERAFLAWELAVNYTAGLLSRYAGADGEPVENAERLLAGFEDLKTRYHVPDFDEDSEDTPNPANVETVIATVERALSDVDPASLVRDVIALFEKNGHTWRGFDQYEFLQAGKVVPIGDEALGFFGDDPEPVYWLSRVDGQWFVRVEPPPPWLVERWREPGRSGR